MTVYAGNFDKLHFTESNLGPPEILGSAIHIPVSGIFLLKDHPLMLKGHGPYAGVLIFANPAQSTRTVVEYIGDPKAPAGFKDPYRVSDHLPPVSADPPLQEYSFEGYMENPAAWIDWIIAAASFEFEVHP